MWKSRLRNHKPFRQAVGVCHRKTPPYAGVRVRYRQPVLMIETVKLPGRVVIDEMRPLLEKALGKAGSTVISVVSGSQSRVDGGGGVGSDTASAQMNDVHIYAFPMTDELSALIEAPCEGAPDLVGPLSYLSELDAAEWRIARLESAHPLALVSRAAGAVCDQPLRAVNQSVCLGVWGPLFPRTGWLTHYSEPVASAVSAYRAVDIASLNMIVPHVVIFPSMFSPDKALDRLQMVYPKTTSCLRIGDNPQFWENGRRSEDGNYVWVYWRQKECCLF